MGAIERLAVPALADEIDAEHRAEELARTCAALQRQLAGAKAKTTDLVAAVMEGAREAAVIVGQPKPVPPPKRTSGKGDDEWAVLHLTDWQMGKRCGEPGDPDYYDTGVCEDRVRYVVDRVLRITAVQRKDHPVPGCVVMFGGDMVEGGGNIYPGQAHEIDSTGFEQVMRAAALMADVVLTLLADFDEVRVASVHGNHGRLGKRGDHAREDNLDHLAYALAREHLRDQGRCSWPVNLGWYERVQVGAWSALLVHGDQVKGWSGTPAAGLARKGTAWSSSMPFPWSDLFLGHYHQRLIVTLPNGAQVRMCPSTESGSVYAAEMMSSRGRPGQSLLYVLPGSGRTTGEYMVWLD